MQVVYSRLFDKLKELGIMQKTIQKDLNLSGATLQKLRRDEIVTVETIGKLCEYLQCTPNDIMEIIPDNDMRIKIKQRQIEELQKQIEELQRQIEELQKTE